DPVLFCAYADKGVYGADANREHGYPELHVEMNDFGAAFRLHDAFDVGMGVGWTSITRGPDDVVRKPTFTPVRLVSRPLLFLPEKLRYPALGALSLYFKSTYVFGPISGEDFGQIPPANQTVFREDFAWVQSAGVLIDVTSLFPPYKPAKRN